MENLGALQSLLTPDHSVQLVRGIIVAGTSGYRVNVAGSVLPAASAESVAVAVGDSVLVAIVNSGIGQAEAIVLCRMSTTGLHPSTGTVTSVPGGSSTIVVTGADGVTYNPYPLAGYTPAVNDNVEMVFLAGTPYATKASPVPVAAPQTQMPMKAPSTPVATGTSTFIASDSATYSGGTWSSPGVGWGQPNEVYCGTSGGTTMHGAWFYGGAAAQLSGRTINAARFTFGQRVGGPGNYGSPATIIVWTHSSANRPSGDITQLNSATWTVQPFTAPTITLTPAQATDLVNGGGIAIYGGDYAAFQGVQMNPTSGILSLDWSR